MNDKTILSCAVTGNITSPTQNPNQPVTPAEIAQAAIDANKAGAAIIHIHVRDLETTEGSMDIGLYKEVVDRIGESGSDLIINLTKKRIILLNIFNFINSYMKLTKKLTLDLLV